METISRMQGLLQSLFTWIFYLFNLDNYYFDEDEELQSLFTWIFYLFGKALKFEEDINLLQSLFTWIFYLFTNRDYKKGSE